jgi:hypothetical protein
MRASYCVAIALCCTLAVAQAEEADAPPLELIELLGETNDDEEADLDIAMSNISENVTKQTDLSIKEVKNDD